ncbi:AraC family transcriptional regulator [Streptoalloteichus hindustanus]|uniref:AraC-type DNA-binding protein n=1 Tax=Streptoalloteichus hindustanus TaxID=2017 RepID=A0A1M5MIL1_STRHI|nr:AraC family transcriptional regulator [Streptoalloteichus hindustanus]SHG77180.1 AraC-type DNA-binding protein [Streptoalloteichus hindustanus]
MDVLSDAIEMMRTGRAVSNRMRLGSRWRYRLMPYDGVGFHVLLRGSGWLIVDGAEPAPINAGDIVLVPHGSSHVLSDSPSAAGALPFDAAVEEPDGPVEFLCGKYRLDRSRAHPLLAGLPEVIHLPAHVGRHPELRAAIELLGGEVHADRPGRHSVLTGLLDLLLVYLVRAWLDQSAESGWPRALRDPEVAAALEALHTDPAAPWRADTLAARVGVSRATLVRRFTTLIGQPPMAYLTWWRMTTAARLLRDSDLPLPNIARQVGYGSPFSFSHAFKRQFGVAPGQYRSSRPAQDSDPDASRAG